MGNVCKIYAVLRCINRFSHRCLLPLIAPCHHTNDCNTPKLKFTRYISTVYILYSLTSNAPRNLLQLKMKHFNVYRQIFTFHSTAPYHSTVCNVICKQMTIYQQMCCDVAQIHTTYIYPHNWLAHTHNTPHNRYNYIYYKCLQLGKAYVYQQY